MLVGSQRRDCSESEEQRQVGSVVAAGMGCYLLIVMTLVADRMGWTFQGFQTSIHMVEVKKVRVASWFAIVHSHSQTAVRSRLCDVGRGDWRHACSRIVVPDLSPTIVVEVWQLATGLRLELEVAETDSFRGLRKIGQSQKTVAFELADVVSGRKDYLR